VRELVRMHGGSTHAMSDGPGKGATFSVAIPLRLSDALRVAPRPSRPQR
jgi:signal transduction histidine kinase